ncbi:putative transposase [Gordonia terrae NBRC 100016]|uniref:Transposase n=1 Tax=Gordonia terrae NBRC 100016 TaxID=1089454 RepID=A0ABQ0HKH7_9ACTN|nr:putative transposase [Gordonia terrae NBRC 100016]VTR09533.1 Uncharacterised protein [Clostridioides difficile]VTS28656.1 Uncharacterised protein [Gordonia terrae]
MQYHRAIADDGIAVAVACRVLQLSLQTYYRWLATRSPMPRRPRRIGPTPCSMPTARTRNSATDSSPGEATIVGETMAERTAWRICRDNAWWSVFGKKRGRNARRPGSPVHDDLAQRNLHLGGAKSVVTDRYHRTPTGEGELYLCAIKDVHSGRIVGYSIDSRMKSRLAVAACTARWAIVVRWPGASLGHPGTASDRDRHLDRTDLPPPAPARSPRSVAACRVRSDDQHRCCRGVTLKLSPIRAAVPFVVTWPGGRLARIDTTKAAKSRATSSGASICGM